MAMLSLGAEKRWSSTVAGGEDSKRWFKLGIIKTRNVEYGGRLAVDKNFN